VFQCAVSNAAGFKKGDGRLPEKRNRIFKRFDSAILFLFCNILAAICPDFEEYQLHFQTFTSCEKSEDDFNIVFQALKPGQHV
jgi:hypothetical protein